MTPTQFIPSLLLSEVFPESIRSRHDIADAMAAVAQAGFFRHFEIPVMTDPESGARIRQLVEHHRLSVTAWSTELMNNEGRSLSALEETARVSAVDRVAGLFRTAAGCGAGSVGVLSGADPGQANRPQALVQLTKSLIELGRISQRDYGVRIAMEPLDRGAHKNGLIGPTNEAVELMQRVKKEAPLVFIGWDSGHTALNGENTVASLRALSPFTCQLHLSNPVLDWKDPKFGDHHYPVGNFGAGTIDEFRQVVAAAATERFPLGRAISLAVEVRTQGGMTPSDTIAHCQSILSQVMQPPNSN